MRTKMGFLLILILALVSWPLLSRVSPRRRKTLIARPSTWC